MKERKLTFKEALDNTTKKAEQDRQSRIKNLGAFVKSTIKKEGK